MLSQVLAALISASMIAPVASAQPLPADPPAPTAVDPIRGLPLWEGAKIGMTPADIRQLFPAARVPADPVALTGGEIEKLELPGLTLAGRPAAAQFFFRGQELVTVQLALAGLKPNATGANIALVKTIAGQLTRDYPAGAAYDCGDRSLGDVAIYECKWLVKPISIRLMYQDVAGQAPEVRIAYRQSTDPSYDR